MDGNGLDRKVCPLAGTCANGGRSSEPGGVEENPKYTCELSARDAEVLDTANSLGESLR